MCIFYIQFNNLQNLLIYDKITTKKYVVLIIALNNTRSIISGLKWNTSNNFSSSETIFPSFYTSQASTDQPLCFKSFTVTSYQSVVNINIIMKFLIGHKAFVSLCTLSHCVLLSLTHIPLWPHTHFFDHIRKWRVSPDEGSAQWRGHLRDNTNKKDDTHQSRTHSF